MNQTIEYQQITKWGNDREKIKRRGDIRKTPHSVGTSLHRCWNMRNYLKAFHFFIVC